ncbi:MAG: helix-turn-helix transcriptional regulator [Pyrinomonadaceae bacterium]
MIVFLDSSYQEGLSVEDIARAVNLSSSHLTHLFKTEVGVPPLQFLKSLRMRKAKELMETTFLNVKQVMNRVGVKDKCHFARDFKRSYGLTPSQYMRTVSLGLRKAKSASE